MDHFSVDKKLELLHQVRSRYERDRTDLIRREQLLYGKTGDYTLDEYVVSEAEDETDNFSTFPLRVLIATGLFLLVIICDMSGKSIFGISAAECFTTISQDYESSIIQWINAAPASDNDIAVENPPAGSRP